MKRNTATLAILAATFGLLAASFAGSATAEPISSKFDGRYLGETDVVRPLSVAACAEGADYAVEILKGSIRGKSQTTDGTIDGIVTSDGFFTATYRFGDGGKTKFEGMIDGPVMVGGLISEDGACTWLVKLQKVS